MTSKEILKELSDFFKAARHLWGRCPSCSEPFRLSEAAISYGAEPPKDWLSRLRRDRERLQEREDEFEQYESEKTEELREWEEGLDAQESDLKQRERDVEGRGKNLAKEVRKMALQIAKNKPEIVQLMRQSNQDAVMKSRATLLGKLFERLAPFLQRFNHDPRDIRAILDPLDYICFDGLTVDRKVNRVTFVEVKAGMSNLSAPERSIVKAIQEGRVSTEVWRFGSRHLPLQQQLQLPKS